MMNKLVFLVSDVKDRELFIHVDDEINFVEIPVSLEQARDLWNYNLIDDCSMAVKRLALCDWDWDGLQRFYADLEEKMH